MRTGMLALAAGLLTLRFLPELPPAWLLGVLPLLGLMLLPFRSYPLAFFLFGFSWACASAQWALDDRLAPELDGNTLWLQGLVVGLPEQGDGVVRFQLGQPESRRAFLPQRLRLAWYGGPALQAGERWRLAVKLKRGHGMVNPQGFDYEAWLLAQRVGGTGTVKHGERISPANGPSAWRDALRQRMLKVYAFGRQGGLVALVIGDGSGLSVADWRLLQDTGTVHLMVISGQHVAMLAALVYALIVALARLGWWPPSWPWLPWACALSFAVALGYGVLAGFEVPVRRACVMIAMVLIWRLRYRHLGVWLPWLLALNGVLLLEPLASLQAGFWLSFGAVAVLMLVFAGRLGPWSWWRSWGRAQWTMAIGLLPALLALGLPVSASGPLANLIAVPWVSFLVVPLALLGTLLLPLFGLGDGLLWLAGGLLELLFQLLAWIASWLPAWSAPAIPWWAWLLGAAGALLILLPTGMPLRALGLALLLPMLRPPIDTPAPGRLDAWVLDVGQGLAVALRTQHHALLYDSGPRYGEFDSGERVVLPSLRTLGVDRLDLMLISHADTDHAGGALSVQRGMSVDRVLSGEPAALAPSLRAELCVDGSTWRWDEVSFTTWRWPSAVEGNPASCVLQIEANGERLLLTGDIDAGAERALLAAGRDIRADWLLAPHHGSRSSSSMGFLKAVQPQAVLISRGANNTFGHPHPQSLARYQALGIPTYDTVVTGAQRIQLGANDTLYGLREQRRFWREK
ncbi:DNA internalization-related competence protein ComEC/Rec2 [Pseudomonas sp. LS44]|uniref:DNA internalization-related competence protein ComEC/Rec2 n=1 Tax=Pseudomonas sp. LS44 TaxID=1357074 RepID=UPI00215B4B32|nr:DNA internalization-related competence protein ComEC/Rec2 [Pseudomonas sp. LS44]UVE19228.1 DNA internalization-related competence protein ComEC/Rec2 [Pseudomonas sp. LS44]